jgi:hypothetical protein
MIIPPDGESRLLQTLTYLGVAFCIGWFGIVFWWASSL